MKRNMWITAPVSLLLIGSLGGCFSKPNDQGPQVGIKIQLSEAVRQKLNSVTVDKYFLNLSGDGIASQTATITTEGKADFALDAGRNRQIKVMALSGLTGSDFVTTSDLYLLSGSSEVFDLSPGEHKSVAIKINSADSLSASQMPWIAKFLDADGNPIPSGKVSFRRSSDGFLLDDVARTDSNGVIYSRYMRFPWPVDVLIDGKVVATGLDFSQNEQSGDGYKITTQATTQVAYAQSVGIAVAVFSLSGAALDDYSVDTMKTSIGNRLDPFTGGDIPDLASHLGTDATLSSLALSTGTLSPTFSSSTTSYTVSVPYTTSSMQVTPSLADSMASLKVNGVNGSSGSASSSLSLAVGANTITVEVTSQNGQVTKSYSIVVTRAAASTNANLSSLALSSGTLSPVFDAATTSYTTSVVNAVSSIQVTPTVADSLATVTVNGTSATSGSASGSINLSVGSNTVTVVVTAQSGATKTYTVQITRASASTNNYLSGLTINPGVLNPTFAQATTSYTALISDLASTVSVTPTADDADATIEISWNSGSYSTVTSGQASSSLSPVSGLNTLSIRVTSGSGSIRTYTISITHGICGAGYYDDGTHACVPVTIGYYSPANDDDRYACTNKPSDSRYTSPTASSSSCPWSCDNGYITTDGVSCTSYPNATILACNDDEVAVGLHGRSGAILDKLGVRCATLNGTSVSTTVRDGPAYGGSGGSAFTGDCLSDNLAVEVDGSYGTWIGQPRTGRLRFRCIDLATNSTLSDWKPSNSTYWGSGTDLGSFNFKCGTGANPYGDYINGIIIDNAGGASYVGKILGITCR